MKEALKLLPLLLVVVVVGVGPVLSAATNAFFHDVYGERSPAGLDNFRALLGDRGMLELEIVGDSAQLMLGISVGEKVVVQW